MLLLVGLGNPGTEYENTRHNVGFSIIDRISDDLKSMGPKVKFHSHYSEASFKAQKIFLQKPLTYMNLSGKAVGEICNFYKIACEHVIVFHDDLDLELGRIKIKIGGGHGGHNGLKSIDQAIGQNYVRFRLGIGKSPFKDQSSHVLGKMTSIEKDIFEKIADFIAINLELILGQEYDKFLNKYSLEMRDKE